ncbi:prepilin-type N-terminal cleavage/methylation domain-containing protein [Paenibacillus pasadenensis]|uniref:PulJ/GspJ family protein n=1 Tax=Paenibacillus pasadenensis TaxID=217090 RepID=UPI00203F5CA4|nr:prepilin-type N-terminal cleavage/methylation domain-containing protein [Paenibacillus pasadenensis]MCM3750062.1 prepilin-type N-terminal cleavage/methylation domain-containing protein [Paenibacillus pasadenensis]
MKRFVNRLRREEGYTLIELIAALSLLSVVMGVIYATVSFGMNAYERVQVQNELREDGDMVMSAIMARLYTVGPSRIEAVPEGADFDQGIRLFFKQPGRSAEQSEELALRTDESGTGYLESGGQRLELDSSLVLDGADGSAIRLTCAQGGQECTSGLLSIRLRLLQTFGGQEYTLDVESKFGF